MQPATMTNEAQKTLIAIPYYSGHGHTKRVAEAVAEGASDAQLINVEKMNDKDWSILDGACGIVFGCPTYMGSTAARYAQFLEDAAGRWDSQDWTDKLAGGFTVGTYPSGDKLSTLIRLSVYAGQMGMIWIGATEIGAPVNPGKPGIDPDGSMLGLMATSSRNKAQLIDENYLETARRYGARFVRAAHRWHSIS